MQREVPKFHYSSSLTKVQHSHQLCYDFSGSEQFSVAKEKDPNIRDGCWAVLPPAPHPIRSDIMPPPSTSGCHALCGVPSALLTAAAYSGEWGALQEGAGPPKNVLNKALHWPALPKIAWQKAHWMFYESHRNKHVTWPCLVTDFLSCISQK